MNVKISAFFSLLLVPSFLFGQQAAPPPFPAVVHLTAEQDHQRTMDLLGMKTIRPGRVNNSASPFAVNYDESKADPDPQLPDPLVLANGKRVTTAKVWWTQRRPQIAELFDREIYGRVPSSTPKVTWTVSETDRTQVGNVAVIIRSLTGHVDNSFYPLIDVDIKVELTTPAVCNRSCSRHHGTYFRDSGQTESWIFSSSRCWRPLVAAAGACQRMGLRDS